MSEPAQKPGRSKQDYGTPRVFLDAAEARFGKIGFDLAADHSNAVADNFFDVTVDALSQSWDYSGVLAVPVAFLNPPFANIRPWAAKLDKECRFLPRWTLMLVPASMGSRWWFDHVEDKCCAFGITRITFVGTDNPYPKDLALLAYGYGVKGVASWAWGDELAAA